MVLPRACLAALAVAWMAACSGSPTSPSVSLGQEFELTPGAAAIVADTSVALRFDGVTGDSRCPVDANCILGGDAIVQISVLSGAGTSPYELHTGSMAPVRHDDLTIALIELRPYPFSSTPIPPEGYRATLRVTR
jgi:hypothetical protein